MKRHKRGVLVQANKMICEVTEICEVSVCGPNILLNV